MENNNNFKEKLKYDVTSQNLDAQVERERTSNYNKFILDQQEPFILFLNFLNKSINELRAQEQVSDILQIRARIKSPISSLTNDNKGKVLNDIFGIEFICASDKEIESVKEKMEKMAKKVIDDKVINKDNGYEAIHSLYSLKDDVISRLNKHSIKRYNKSLFPVIETHYETAAVYYEANFGRARHDRYKQTDMDYIRTLHHNGQFIVGVNLPIMWVSDPDNDEMRALTVDEIIKKLYPSLQLHEEDKSRNT